MKTITIEDELWKKLTKIKLDKGKKTMSDVIEELVRNNRLKNKV